MDDALLWLTLVGVFGAIVGVVVGWGRVCIWIETRHHARIATAGASPKGGAVSNVSVNLDAAPVADKQTDRQTDQVSALLKAMEQKQLDRTRTLIIDNAVSFGWGVGQVRALVKGDSGAIGAEVEEARKRLGIDAPQRTIPVRDAAGVREMTMEN